MMPAGRIENKALRGPAERKAGEVRVPSGDVDGPLFIRRLEDETHGTGAVALVDIRHRRRSPAEVSDKDDAFHPTAAGVVFQAHYAASVIEGIAKAAGLSVVIREPNREAA